MPGNAAALAVTEGLPPVYPAPGLYTAMLRLGISQSGQRPVRREAASGLATWLAEEHRQDAIRLLVSGERLAQESVGLAYLSGTTTGSAASGSLVGHEVDPTRIQVSRCDGLSPLRSWFLRHAG